MIFKRELKLCYKNNFPIIISEMEVQGKKKFNKKIFKKKENNKINELYLYSTMYSSELLGSFNKSNIKTIIILKNIILKIH